MLTSTLLPTKEVFKHWRCQFFIPVLKAGYSPLFLAAIMPPPELWVAIGWHHGPLQ